MVKNIDRLFGYPQFSAAPNLYETLDQPDAWWPRTDQTFLESWLPDWHGLPYTFNTLQYVFFNLPQLWQWSAIHVLHYQYEKPWQEHNPRRAELLPLIELWHRTLDGHPPPPPLELRTPHG